MTVNPYDTSYDDLVAVPVASYLFDGVHLDTCHGEPVGEIVRRGR